MCGNGGHADVFLCHVCGAIQTKQEFVAEALMIDGKPILVEGIPAAVCASCGEAVFSRETAELIRRMVRGQAKPA